MGRIVKVSIGLALAAPILGVTAVEWGWWQLFGKKIGAVQADCDAYFVLLRTDLIRLMAEEAANREASLLSA